MWHFVLISLKTSLIVIVNKRLNETIYLKLQYRNQLNLRNFYEKKRKQEQILQSLFHLFAVFLNSWEKVPNIIFHKNKQWNNVEFLKVVR